ncbi:MAG: archease [Syntrophorhabdaceae bacterium]|nr:archease [Syntrophorhabdaceae bacterium]MDD5244015.1 archease [Syntrophorhabdaceae bacterium]
MERYRILDHEADAGFEVYGGTMEELFQNGVYALFSLITDIEVVQPLIEKRITVNGNGELFINLLNDSLYMWDTEGFIPKTLSIHVGREHAEGVARGEIFDPVRHLIKQEVKAVTYHKFRIVEEKGMLKATVIVDL